MLTGDKKSLTMKPYHKTLIGDRMDNFKSAQNAYDNAVPEWYWEKYFGSHLEDEDRIEQIENDLWDEMDEGLISEKEYLEKIKLLDQFKSGEINLLELNLKF